MEKHSNENDSNQNTILQPHTVIDEDLRHDFSNIFDCITAVFNGPAFIPADDYLTVDVNMQSLSRIYDAYTIEILKGPTPTKDRVAIMEVDNDTEMPYALSKACRLSPSSLCHQTFSAEFRRRP